MCAGHYSRWQVGADLNSPILEIVKHKVCTVADCCENPVCKGLCRTHYDLLRRHGTTDVPTTSFGECCVCGAVTESFPGRKPPKYCSAACKCRAHREKNRPNAAVCKGCGKVFYRPAGGGRLRQYCNMTCWRHANPTRSKAIQDKEYAKKREEYEDKRASTVKACAQCGKEFTPGKLVRQMYCSKKCSDNHFRENQTVPCSIDGCERPKFARGLCNRHYREILVSEGRITTRKYSDEERIRRRAYQQKRRGAAKGQGSEFIDNLAVFERDNWTCGICGEPVDPDLVWPDKMSATLDHIQPLSLGGAHSYQNVQCAHFHCNCSKGNRVA